MIELFTAERVETELARSLRCGKLPDHFLYTGVSGADNWVALDASSGFNVATTLTQLLAASIEDIAATFPAGVNLAGIGIGSGEKERLVLDALLAHGQRPDYYPVDVSADLVAQAVRTVADLDIHCTGISARLEDAGHLQQYLQHPLLITVLGNNFCNYQPAVFFDAIRQLQAPGDALLFDAQLFNTEKDTAAARSDIEAAYASESNIHFNLGPLLDRGVPRHACDFNLELIQEETRWGTVYRTRKSVRMTQDVQVRCGRDHVDLARDKCLRMGFTYKYTLDQLHAVIADHGFGIRQEQMSSDGGNALFLAVDRRAEQAETRRL